MKKFKEFGIYDFSDYAEEITGNALFKINGGAEVENSHEGVAGAKPGDTITRIDGTVVTLKQADIDYANAQLENNGNDGTGNTNGNSGTGNNSNSGSNNTSNSRSTNNSSSGANNTGISNTSTSESTPDVSEEIKQNSDAYANYMSLQGRAKDEGEPDRYKGYNVLGSGKIKENSSNEVSASSQILYKSIESSKWSYIPIEGVGINGASVFKTNAIKDKDGNIEINVLGNFVGKNLVDSSRFYGNATLVVDGKEVETRPYRIDKRDSIWDGNYDRVGSATFSYDCSKAKNIQIISDVDLIIGSNGLGNTVVNYTPTYLELF